MTPRTPRPPTPTHFVRWDDPGKRVARALCGVLVYRKDHSNDPTCADCAAEIVRREKRVIE